LHERELRAVFLKKSREAGGIVGLHRSYLMLHCCDVRCSIYSAAGSKLNPVLRIEAHHFDFIPQGRASGTKNFVEDALVEKESRTEIEFEAIGFDARSATADHWEPFENADTQSSSGELNGCGQSTGTSANDNDILVHENCGGR
jgi:hypothetical protein